MTLSTHNSLEMKQSRRLFRKTSKAVSMQLYQVNYPSIKYIVETFPSTQTRKTRE